MRKFLVEMEQEITLDELKRGYYEQVAEDGESFDRYLWNCMWWNNGALTEVLTADTPKGWENRAVVKCRPDGEEQEVWLPVSKFGLF